MATAPMKQQTEKRQAPSVAYLVHFPDRTSAVHKCEIGRVADEGTEILDGWIVDTIRIIDETVDGDPVSYAVWVRKASLAHQRDGAGGANDPGRLRPVVPRKKQAEESEKPLQVTPETRQKIAGLPARLSDGFADVAPSEVREEVEEVTETLLDDARFEDFVPLLAYRHAREHLLEDGHEPIRDE